MHGYHTRLLIYLLFITSLFHCYAHISITIIFTIIFVTIMVIMVINLPKGYLDALHAESAPMRATMTTDALRALSCALSLTEFLHMVPPHIRSLVICCPQPMRLIPWHLLLIEEPNNQPFVRPVTSPANSRYGGFGVDMKDVRAYMNTQQGQGLAGSGAGVGMPPEGGLDNNGGSTEIHLLEKFAVRLGPSLALFELNAVAGKALRHSVGLHRMAAVDGEAEHPDRSAGIRGTDLEVACVSHTWSADPDDYHVLLNESAAPRALQTVIFGNENDEAYAKFKETTFIRRREKINHIRIKRTDKDIDGAISSKVGVSKRPDTGATTMAEAPKDEKEKKKEERRRRKGKSQYDEEGSEGDSSSEDEEAEEDSDEEEEEDYDIGRPRTKQRRKRKFDKEADFDMKFLTMCRVLHIAAPKVSLGVLEAQRSQEQRRREAHGEVFDEGGGTGAVDPLEAAIELPQFDRLLNYRNPKMKKRIAEKKRTLLQQDDDSRNTLSSRDIIRQIFVRNCALCVLSRFGLCDDVPTVRNLEKCDSNCEFIEAMHLAGAKGVMYPLWSGGAQGGLTTLAHLIFMVRFYSILPAHSKNPHAVVETVRRSQLWLRNATADDVIAFIHKAPIPARARKVIIEEMEAYVDASLTPAQRKQKKEALRKLKEATRLADAPNLSSNLAGRGRGGAGHELDAEGSLLAAGGGARGGAEEESHGLTSGPSFILPANSPNPSLVLGGGTGAAGADGNSTVAGMSAVSGIEKLGKPSGRQP